MIIHRHIFITFDSHNNLNVVIMRANPKTLGSSIENKYYAVTKSSTERLELLLNRHDAVVSLHNKRIFWDILKIV